MVRERVGDWRAALTSTLAGLVAGLLVFGALQSGVLDGPFFAAQDRLFPAPAPDPAITLIAIDQKSRDQLGPDPVSNGYHAQVISNLSAMHPKVILFDVLLDHSIPDPDTGANTDGQLAQAIQKAGNVVLVCTASDGPIDPLVVGEPIADIGLGEPDPANAIRTMALTEQSTCLQNEAHESAVVQAIRIVEGDQDPIDVQGNVARFGKHTIPLVGDQMVVNYTLGSGAATCSYVDAFNGDCPASLITNRVVIVGTKLVDNGDIY